MPETLLVTSMISQFKIGENISVEREGSQEYGDVCVPHVCLGACVKDKELKGTERRSIQFLKQSGHQLCISIVLETEYTKRNRG